MKFARYVVMGLIQLYRWVLSPLKTAIFGPLSRCRFEPSCSAYALQAFKKHNFITATRLSARRICRCNPWGGCGHDPVPEPADAIMPLAPSTAGKPNF